LCPCAPTFLKEINKTHSVAKKKNFI